MLGSNYLDAGVRGYLHNTAARWVGKIAGCDYSDLVQEGYVCFYKCIASYVGRPPRKCGGKTFRRLPTRPDAEARRHFMALLKTSVTRRMLTLVEKGPAHRELVLADLVEEGGSYELALEAMTPPEPEVSSLMALLSQAPQEIMDVVSVLVTDTSELGTSFRRYGKRGRRSGPRETTERFVTRVAKRPLGSRPVQELRDYLIGESLKTFSAT